MLKINLGFFGEKVNTTNVGRWMSRAEYDAMIKTGKVQESHTNGTTYVAKPASADSLAKQSNPGSIYVEFEVPTYSLKATHEGWARIIGPNTIDARLMDKKGARAPTTMPNATNIKIIRAK
jgi:hypothetical protein